MTKALIKKQNSMSTEERKAQANHAGKSGARGL